MIAWLSWFNESIWGATFFAVSSLLDLLPIIIIPLLIFWGIESFFSYIVGKSRFALSVNKQVKSLDYSFFCSPVAKNNRAMKYWYNPDPMYDEWLKSQASLKSLKDEDDLTDFTTFSNFYEQSWPHVKYGIDESVWNRWGASHFYSKNDDDFFSEENLSGMREESRNQYWDFLDIADIPHSEKIKKYNSFCALQDEYSYKKFVW